MFETIAFLSTLAFIVVFVTLFQMDRAEKARSSGKLDDLDKEAGRNT